MKIPIALNDVETRIENWCLVTRNRSGENEFAQLDLAPILSLSGNIYNHPGGRRYDGCFVFTSEVQVLDLKSRTARTCNTTYQLGEPSIKWIQWLSEKGQMDLIGSLIHRGQRLA